MANPRIYFDNRFADAPPVASSTAAGTYAAANLADWRKYTWWKGGVLPADVTVDCGVAKAADYALFMGHDMKSVGASVEIRGSTDNFVASDVLVSSGTPANDDPFLLSWSSVSYRYWRARIIGATAPAIAIAAIGAVLEFPAGLQQGFDPLGRSVHGTNNRNANGHPLGRVIDFEEWSAELFFEKVSWTWLRSTFLPAWRAHLRGTPFAFGWDTATYGQELVLVNAGMEWSAPHYSGALADLAVKVSGVIT
jgi:hypothetical protein